MNPDDPVPDYAPSEDLPVGEDDGLAARSNIQANLYNALRKAVDDIARRFQVTNIEVQGALGMVQMDIWEAQKCDDSEDADPSEQWKHQ